MFPDIAVQISYFTAKHGPVCGTTELHCSLFPHNILEFENRVHGMRSIQALKHQTLPCNMDG